LLANEVDIAVLPSDLQKEAESKGFKRIKAKAEAGTGSFLNLLGPWLNKKFASSDPEPVPGGQVYRYPNSPLMDDRVRKALNKAINRDELNKAYWGGEGLPIHNWAYLPSRPGWNPDWVRRFPEEYGYDPRAATQLLSAAGFGSTSPLSHTMLNTGGFGIFPELADVTESLAQYFRAVGVAVRLETVEPALYRQRRIGLEYDNHSRITAISVNQFVGMASAGGVSNGYTSGRGFAEFAEPNALMHDSPNGLRWTIDPKQAEAKWRQLGDLQYNLHAPIPLFYLPTYATVNPKTVADYQFSGTLSGTFTNVEYIKAAV
jgi:ABC-type transport system substrate-binding protein